MLLGVMRTLGMGIKMRMRRLRTISAAHVRMSVPLKGMRRATSQKMTSLALNSATRPFFFKKKKESLPLTNLSSATHLSPRSLSISLLIPHTRGRACSGLLAASIGGRVYLDLCGRGWLHRDVSVGSAGLFHQAY